MKRALLMLVLLSPAAALGAVREVGSVEDARCETVPWPVYGEARAEGGRVYRATAGGLVVVDGGIERVLTTCDGLPSTHVVAVTALPDGSAMLAFRGLGLYRLDGATLAIAKVEVEPGALAWTTALAVHDGHVLAGTVQEGLFRLTLTDGAWKAEQPWKALRKDRVSALAIGADGAPLIARDFRGLWTLTSKGKPARLVKGSVQGVRVLADGRVLLDRGVEVCGMEKGSRKCEAVPDAPVQAMAPPRAGLPSNHVTALVAHADGTGTERLWAGTFDQGVVVRIGDRWEVPRAEGEVPRFVNQLVSSGPDLWAATPTGAYRLRDGVWKRYGETAGLLTDRVNAVQVDESGAVWFGTSEGLSVWDERGIHTLTKADGLPHRIVHTVASAGGVVYAGTTDGLAIVRDGRVESARTEQGRISSNWVNALATVGGQVLLGTYDSGVDRVVGDRGTFVEELGRIWVNPNGIVDEGGTAIATLGNGLWRESGGEWLHYQGPGVLPSDDVTSVARFDGRLWVGTRGGIVSFVEGGRR